MKSRNLFLAFLIVLEGCSGSAVEEIRSDWVLIGGTRNIEGMGEVKVFIDKNSLDKNGDFATFKDKSTMSNDADGVVEIISTVEMDCMQKLSRIKRSDIYLKNGKVEYDTNYGEWESVNPDSSTNGFSIYQFVCLKNYK